MGFTKEEQAAGEREGEVEEGAEPGEDLSHLSAYNRRQRATLSPKKFIHLN